MSPIVNSFHKKSKILQRVGIFFFVAFWMKWICFHNFIMKVCLMQKQMHQIQKVINTACVATYGKSEVRKISSYTIRMSEHIKWNISCICLGLLGRSPVPVFSRAPLWSCFLMANMASKCRLAFWGGKQNISGGAEGWARRYTSFTTVSCSSTDFLCFAGALLHAEKPEQKLLPGMFAQTSLQYFKLLTSCSFIVLLNDKVQFLNHPHVLLYQLLILGMFILVWF